MWILIQFTAVTDEQYKNRYRMCLAWLREAGIQLIPWDWDVFSNAVGINKATRLLQCCAVYKGPTRQGSEHKL